MNYEEEESFQKEEGRNANKCIHYMTIFYLLKQKIKIKIGKQV